MPLVEMHNAGYGECTVLRGGGDALMVDCGSSNRLVCGADFHTYVLNGVMPRYAGLCRRTFLLTHCHRDHISGLWRILRKDPFYFDRLLLPVSPCDSDGRFFLLEFAFYVRAFLSRLTGYSHVNTGELELFGRAAELAGAQRVFPVQAGDAFDSGGTPYEILWPQATGFRFSDGIVSAVEQAEALLSQPYRTEAVSQFFSLKQAFCSAYAACGRGGPLQPENAALLRDLLMQADALRASLLFIPNTEKIIALLSAQETQDLYSQALNAASVVFQNIRTGAPGFEDILMTGDAPPETLQAVSGRLHDGYYILKAPHHGTESAWSPLLEEIAAEHILISNGEYTGGGLISPRYPKLDGIKHCTNSSVCPCFRESGSCCNRLARCYEQRGRAALTVSCPAVRNAGKKPACGISVFSPVGGLACLCDLEPRNFA